MVIAGIPTKNTLVQCPMNAASFPPVDPAGGNGYLTAQRVGEGTAASERTWTPTSCQAGPEKIEVSNGL